MSVLIFPAFIFELERNAPDCLFSRSRSLSLSLSRNDGLNCAHDKFFWIKKGPDWPPGQASTSAQFSQRVQNRRSKQIRSLLISHWSWPDPKRKIRVPFFFFLAFI